MTSQYQPRLPLQPAVLLWARKRAELTDDELAHKVRLKVERVQEWERSGQISMAWAERLADATHTPLGYLFLTSPPDEPLPIRDFRTRGGVPLSQPSADLLETVYAMQRRQDWMREELIETGAEPLDFVDAYHPNGNYRAVAEAMRDVLRLAHDWTALARTPSDDLLLLRDRAEDAGIFVVFNGIVGNNTRRKLDPDEFQGFILADEYAPLVFVNNADDKAARVLTLAHELAHIFIGETGLSGFTGNPRDRNYIEEWCMQTASEFLVPGIDWGTMWDSIMVQSRVTKAIGFDVVLENTEDDWFEAAYYSYGWTAAGRATSNRDYFWDTQSWRIGRRFAEMVIRAVRAGRLPYREAYTLTGLSGNTFENMAERMGLRL